MPETLRSHTGPVAKKGSPAPLCSLTSHPALPLPHSPPAPHRPLQPMWHTVAQNWMAGDSTARCAPHFCHVPTSQPGSHDVQNTRGVNPCAPHPLLPAPSSKGQAVHAPAAAPWHGWALGTPSLGTRLCLPWGHWRAARAAGMQWEGGGGSCCCPGFPRIKYEQPCCVILNC